ncbi:MAG: restriction endonuclease subunit S, partial [Crenarchaeota archaeon]|nr:restriction endonuclease subunit S [Thermoproteota archaeon]
FGVPLEDDILLTSVGSLGVPYKVKRKDKFYFKDGNLTWFRNLDKSKVIPDFLFTWISSNVGKQKLDEVSIGSTQAALTISGLKTIEILLPDLKTQKSIASILSSLDEKIDLLHRQNITLEKMAETLFRQWFVEEAKEDWEEISLYDAIELVGGGTPKTTVNEYWDGNIKWLSGGDIAGNHKNFVVSSEKSITELGLKNSSAKLLPKFSTVISARGTVGKYCMLSEPMTFSQSNYGILPKFKNCFFFTYLLVAHSVDELQSAAYGSVFDTITTNTFKGLTITLPEEEYIIRFNESMEPYFSKILTNQTQIRTLSALRNTLLPKLMSGVVTIEC